jgi:hypothetical protein
VSSFGAVLLILGVTCYAGGMFFQFADGTSARSSRPVWHAFRRIGLGASAFGILILCVAKLVG